MKIPEIKIQLVHIDGPFKGEINEYLSPVVTLGRHPDCDVVFPEEMRNISRRHADIQREGNRFLLRDTSSNGTFVNGKQNAEVFLKNGDVLILGVGGPKISFLSTILESNDGSASRDIPTQDPVVSRPPTGIPASFRSAPTPSPQPEKRMFAPVSASPPELIMSVQKSLVIQHGVFLKAFKTLPVTLGKGADCDFVLRGTSILEHHAQIFFEQGQYWIKDLTGRNMLSLNAQAVQTKAPLLPDGYLSLSPEGPKFQFLGDGRLVEVEAAGPVQSNLQSPYRPARSKPDHQMPVDERKKIHLLIGGMVVLCIGAALLLYAVTRDGNGIKEFFSTLPVEKGVQFIKHLLGKE
jgi:pSer/pThr/pTyr-binding forkhead associated (FHA) protein